MNRVNELNDDHFFRLISGKKSLDKTTKLIKRGYQENCITNGGNVDVLSEKINRSIEAKQEYYRNMNCFKKAFLFVFDSAYRKDHTNSKAIIRAKNVQKQVNKALKNKDSLEKNYQTEINSLKDDKDFQRILANQKKYEGKVVRVNNKKCFVSKKGVYVSVGEAIGEGALKKIKILVNVNNGALAVQETPCKEKPSAFNPLEFGSTLAYKFRANYMGYKFEKTKSIRKLENVAQQKELFNYKSKNRTFKKYAVISSYYSENNLDTQILSLTEQEKKQISLDIMHGISNLHQKKKIHRDLKPANILIKRDTKGQKRGYVADFDTLAHDSFFSRDKLVGVGTLGFHDINIDINQYDFSSILATNRTADIFSAGVTLYCIREGKTTEAFKDDVVNRLNGYKTIIDFNSANVASFIKNKLKNQSDELSQLIKEMIKVDQKKRPTAQRVYERLSGMDESLFVPVVKS